MPLPTMTLPSAPRRALFLALGAGAAAVLLAYAAPVAVPLPRPASLLPSDAVAVAGHMPLPDAESESEPDLEADGDEHAAPRPGHALKMSASRAAGFFPAFTQSLLLILACELGDRTFFVAAILAMKAPRLVVFAGAITALALMTVLSALMGRAFPMFLDKRYTSVAAAALFAFFGLQLLRTWWSLRGSAGENEELAEVEEELNDDKRDGRPAKSISGLGLGASAAALLSPIFIKSFTMTGLAEWGDRSQIATIALAAQQDMWGVIAGGIVGHACCTTVAVVGGRLLATRISERAVALIGGLLFLSFAVLTASGKLE